MIKENHVNKTQNEWAVIFDVDGTMVNNLKYHQLAWIELGRRYNLPIDKDFYREKIHSRAYQDIINNNLAHLIEAKDATAIYEEKEAIYREMFAPAVAEIPGLKKLLEELDSLAVPCAIASNSPAVNIDMVLEKLELTHIFKVIVDCMQVLNGKPDPEIFLKASQKLSVPPNRCIVIEDSISGFKAACRAKMRYIAITAGADESNRAASGASAIHEDFTTITASALENYIQQ